MWSSGEGFGEFGSGQLESALQASGSTGTSPDPDRLVSSCRRFRSHHVAQPSPLAPMSPCPRATPGIEKASTCRTGSTPDLPRRSSGLFSSRSPVWRPCPGPLGLCVRPGSLYVLLSSCTRTVHHLLVTSTQHQARFVAQRRPPTHTTAPTPKGYSHNETEGIICRSRGRLRHTVLSWIIHFLCVSNDTPFGDAGTTKKMGGCDDVPSLGRNTPHRSACG